MDEVDGPVSLQTLCLRSKKRTRELFLDTNIIGRVEDTKSYKVYITTKINSEYAAVKDLPPPRPKQVNGTSENAVPTKTTNKAEQKVITLGPNSYPSRPGVSIDGTQAETVISTGEEEEVNSTLQQVVETMTKNVNREATATSHSLIAIQNNVQFGDRTQTQSKSKALTIASKYAMEKPSWHAPWKLMRVISGHLGWVRAIAVDPSNEWFATGAADRTIKIWDLASGVLKLTLTGHINCVRGIAISNRHPYLFSCGEDKMVKCWDLECNKVVRHYHGHLSGVYCMALHPTIDVLVTGGRDSVARVWDMRTKSAIHVLSGHSSTVASIVCQSTDPQVITGSHDSTIRLWDLAKGSCYSTLTHHKKSVRSLVLHPSDYAMASGAPDNIKSWKFPEGKFIRNFRGHQSIIHSMAVNSDNVLVSGADNGSLYFWDWKSGYNFQKIQTTVQPGSLDSEAGIFGLSFDQTGSRLITAEADKTIKIYKEDDTVSEESFPIADDWRSQLDPTHK